MKCKVKPKGRKGTKARRYEATILGPKGGKQLVILLTQEEAEQFCIEFSKAFE